MTTPGTNTNQDTAEHGACDRPGRHDHDEALCTRGERIELRVPEQPSWHRGGHPRMRTSGTVPVICNYMRVAARS
jgi:hypothetical protein